LGQRFVTPIRRNGRVVEYQSVRTKPQPAQIAAAERLYAQLRETTTLRTASRCSGRTQPVALLGGVGATFAAVTTAVAATTAGTLVYLALAPLQRLVEQAEQAACSLQGINSQVNEISEMSIQIAAAVEQQSAVSGDINQNIVSIRSGSDHHVESGLRSRKSASGVAELVGRPAGRMEMLVDQFWTRRRA